MCGERPGQYCNLSPLNHAMAGKRGDTKLVKAIILIRGGAEEPNMLSEWGARRHTAQGEGRWWRSVCVCVCRGGGHAVY